MSAARLGALLLLAACGWAETVADGLLRLGNDRVQVALSPRLGGRIVELRRPGGANVLAADAITLAMPAADLPQPSPQGGFLPGQGHVVWFGPQRAWWAQQDAEPQRRDARATWPPDPYVEYGAMRVASASPEAVELIGRPSAVSGLEVRLRVAVAADGAVVQRIEARNAGPRTVAWDIWPNTRAPADARLFAPYEAGTRLRYEHASQDPAAVRQLAVVARDGLLGFDVAAAAADPGRQYSGKLFLTARRPHLFAALAADVLIVAAPPVDPAEVHPDHAPVEVFQCLGGDPRMGVLELEFHAPYRTLAPGEGMRSAVAWLVAPLPPGGDPAQRVRALAGDAARLVDRAAEAAR